MNYTVFLVLLSPALVFVGMWIWVTEWRPTRCGIFGHKLEVLQFFGKHACRLVCHQCGGQWVHKVLGDMQGASFPWDDDFAELYSTLGYPIRRWPRGRR